MQYAPISCVTSSEQTTGQCNRPTVGCSVVDGQFMGSFSYLSEFMRYQPKHYGLDCLSRRKRSWIYIYQCKAPNDGSEFVAPLVMCESLYSFQDFLGAKGLLSHLKGNCQNTELSFCAKTLKVILLACIYSETYITAVTLKGLSVTLSEYSYNI